MAHDGRSRWSLPSEALHTRILVQEEAATAKPFGMGDEVPIPGRHIELKWEPTRRRQKMPADASSEVMHEFSYMSSASGALVHL